MGLAENVPQSEGSVGNILTEEPQLIGQTAIEALAKRQEEAMGTTKFAGSEKMRATITRRPDGQTTPDD